MRRLQSAEPHNLSLRPPSVAIAALRTWEAAALGAVDLDIEVALVGVERAGPGHAGGSCPSGRGQLIGLSSRVVDPGHEAQPLVTIGRTPPPDSCRRAPVRDHCKNLCSKDM